MEGKWELSSKAYALANAKWNKDSHDILMNTFAPKIDAAIQQIQQSNTIHVYNKKTVILRQQQKQKNNWGKIWSQL